MKQNELERKERELRKEVKRSQKISNKKTKDSLEEGPRISSSEAFSRLVATFRHDDTEIYNIKNNETILELLLEMQVSFSAKQIEGIIRRAIRKTKISNKQEAFSDVAAMLN